MYVKFEGSFLTINTEITQESARKYPYVLTNKAYDGEELYRVTVGDTGAILECGMVCNAVVDGCLAVCMVMPMGTTLDDIKREYGYSLMNAEDYVKEIKTNMDAAERAFDRLFR